MKKLFATFAVFALVLTLGACKLADEVTDNDLAATSYLAIDINPGVELIIDEDGIVISVGHVNEAAEVLVGGLELEGIPHEEALDKILESAIEAGYIDVDSDENIVTITADNEDLENEAKDNAQTALEERGVGAAIFGGEMKEEYFDLAEEYDIGVGRARLISRAVEIDEALTFEEALELSHGEIMQILRDAHRAHMDEFIAERREQAQAMKEEMREMARDRVEQHRDRVEQGEVETPDYEQIREDVEARIDVIREERQQAMQERREQARDRMNGMPGHSDNDEE